MHINTDLGSNGMFFQVYLEKLTKSKRFVSKLNQIHAFLAFSGYNKVVDDSIYYQGQLKKKVGGHFTTNRCMKCLQSLFSAFRDRWFVITSEGMSYCKHIKDSTNGFMDMLFFDRTVRVRLGSKATGQAFCKIIFI